MHSPSTSLIRAKQNYDRKSCICLLVIDWVSPSDIVVWLVAFGLYNRLARCFCGIRHMASQFLLEVMSSPCFHLNIRKSRKGQADQLTRR